MTAHRIAYLLCLWSWAAVVTIFLFFIWLHEAVGAERLIDRSYILPPAEFDHRPDKTILIDTMEHEQRRKICMEPTGLNVVRLACAFVRADGCRVVIAPDGYIRSMGFDPADVLRHEIGHCNGWPADHPGARPVGASIGK